MEGLNHLNLLVYEDIFSDRPLSVAEYINGIPKRILIEIFVELNNKFERNYDQLNIVSSLEYFLRTTSSTIRSDIITKAINKEYKHKNKWKVILATPVTSLGLIQDALNYQEPSDTNERTERKVYELNLFKAILVKNGETDNRSVQEIQSISDPTLKDRIELSTYLTIMLPDYDIINRNIFTVFACQIKKANILFSFLRKEVKYERHYEKLLNSFSVVDAKEIFKHYIELSKHVFSAGKRIPFISVPGNEHYSKYILFLDKFCAMEIQETDYDFLEIRSKPLYKVEEGLYMVVNSLLLFEKIYKSWFFELRNINQNLSTPISNFKSDWGLDFSEEYLTYNILKGIFNRTAIQYSGREIKEEFHELVGEPDYYVRDGNKIYLFESKDILIEKSVKQSYAPDKIANELKLKLYKKTHSGRVKNKAILQLLENIRRVLKNQLIFDEISKPDKLDIYPILILHEEIFNSAGINCFVNIIFQEELKLLEESFNIRRVKPIVIVTIDTLILIKENLMLKRPKFFELLDKYCMKHLNEESKISFFDFVRNEKYIDFTIVLRKILKQNDSII